MQVGCSHYIWWRANGRPLDNTGLERNGWDGCHQSIVTPWGPSIKYVTLFLTPLPCHTCHTSWDPPKYVTHLGHPRFLVGLIQKAGQKPPVQILSQLFAGVFVREFCQGVFSLEGFVRGGFCPFPLLSENISYNRKLNITLNFMLHMYDKKIISVTSHALDPSPPVSNCHTFSDPPLTWRTYGPLGNLTPCHDSHA